MADFVAIPIFPLSIFPLPGEMVPLHIFEPRYRQLLQDAEEGVSFGIYFNSSTNNSNYGSLVKLESVIKRYATGESDIIVKCYDLFTLHALSRTYQDKLYPGGEVELMNVSLSLDASSKLASRFEEYLRLAKINTSTKNVSAFHIANELNLDLEGKLRFVNLDEEKREVYLQNQLDYQTQLLHKAEKAKDVFHLN
jgi:uncharacterized protein